LAGRPSADEFFKSWQITTGANEMRVRPIFVAFGLSLALGCSAARVNNTNVTSIPPPKVILPTLLVAKTPTNLTRWTVATDRDWTHLHSSLADLYVHGRKTYVLASGHSNYAGGTFAPYLVVIDDKWNVPAIESHASLDRGLDASPKTGTAIIKRGSGAEDYLDLTFTDRGVVRTLADYSGPKVVDLYEADCSGCQIERSQLEALSEKMRNAHGILVIATSAAVTKSQQELIAGRVHAPIVLDNHRSLYALLNVQNLPVAYYLTRSGQIVDDSLGNLTDSDVVQYAAEITSDKK
jgi:peroxiredoxin